MSYSAAALREALGVHAPAGITGLVVALSGGADSSSLLAAAAACGATSRGLGLRAVHIDHGLQSAANSFRESCAGLCAALDIPLTVIPVAVQTGGGASLEAAARSARYAALERELEAGECLVTAHHREDQAETLLLQALRGAGLKGMSAMPICRPLGRGWHLRPLLAVPQAELLAFGQAALCSVAPAPAPDPMNRDPRFDRGFLRREIWPQINQRWPGAAAALSRTARHAAEAQASLECIAAADVGRLRDGEALSLQGLRAMQPEARVNALRFWLSEAGAQSPPAARIGEALRQVFEAKADQLPCIRWGEFALRRYRQRLFLTLARPPRLEGTHSWIVVRDSRLDLGPRLGELRWIRQAGGIDVRRLPPALSVRRRAGGEALRTEAHARTHTLQHLCQTYGVLPWMRDALPLIFANDALLAVADLWMDARWRVGAGEPGLGVLWQRAPMLV